MRARGYFPENPQCPPRQRNKLDSPRAVQYPSLQPTQPVTTSFNAQYPAFSHHLTNPNPLATTSWTTNSPMQHPMESQPQNHFTTPAEESEFRKRELANWIAQCQSLEEARGEAVHQQLIPNGPVYSNHGFQPMQQNGTRYQPQIQPPSPAYPPYHPAVNGNNGQQFGGNSVATLSQSPEPAVPFEGFPAHPTMIDQRFEQTGHQYPETRNAPLMHPNGMTPYADLNPMITSQNCLCGPSCNCVMCAMHPHNNASYRRAEELAQILADDNYQDGCMSEPQSDAGGALTNGTNIESVMGLENMHLNGGSFPSDPLGWHNMPTEGHVLQSTTFDEEFVDNSDPSTDFSFRRMRNTAYFTVEYQLGGGSNNGDGLCLCGSDSTCDECPTHSGNTEHGN